MGHCASTMAITSSARNRRRIHKKEWIHDHREHGMLKRSGARCLAVVREKRSRFYIVRRCVFMLIFWHKYAYTPNPQAHGVQPQSNKMGKRDGSRGGGHLTM
ncbi:hypothetical protein QVD17_05041 [Tagetes erecta]|uniref:Uncharacterized protein n=1 Tax=Tagetes erecta TaxID=13708 RepID=A0AAD8LKP9_TARER|nr:hypothetical protein QVD17_05041 [Tagetes erecta]